MPSKLKCNIYVKCALFNIGIFILSFVGTSYLTRKGLPGLSTYREEQQYQPSQCYVARIDLFSSNTSEECVALDTRHTRNFSQCLEILDSKSFQNGDATVYTDNYLHTKYLRYSVNDMDIPRDALEKLMSNLVKNKSFECFISKEHTPIYKKIQSLTDTVNFIFWPILSIVVCWTAVIVCCYRLFMKNVQSADTLRLFQFQMACEEGNIEKLSKYLISRHVKTPLDEKCNLQHFRRNATIDINAKNGLRSSSLRCAILGKKYKLASKSHLECIELLLMHGANVQDATFPPKENMPDGLTIIAVYLYSKKPHLKWYALALTRVLIAAGYKMNAMGQKYLVHLLLTESVCNETEQNPEEQFMRLWGYEMFPRQVLAEGIETLDVNVGDLQPAYRERANDFITFISTGSKEVGSLQHLCRLKVRQHLIEQHTNRNLYFLVTQLPLSINMIRYLLFDLKPPKLSYYDYTTIYFEESFV